jgi:dephospho-CoA kinase
MPAIGITGGVSTGKSTFCECLRELLPEASFFDADQAAHELVALDEVKKALLDRFGPDVFSPNGGLNRAALRAIIFDDAAKRRALEQILHPRIRRQWSAEAEKHRKSPEFFFADIPLLYETGGESLCDRVVVVACSPEIQLANLTRKLGRMGIPPRGDHRLEADATAMINSQMSLQEKIKRADHVVWNNGPRKLLAAEAADLVGLWRAEKWTKI